MVNLVMVDPNEIDLETSNQILVGLLTFLGVPLQYKTKTLTSPNFIIPFDCNLLILVVEHAYMICPTTFIVKIIK